MNTVVQIPKQPERVIKPEDRRKLNASLMELFAQYERDRYQSEQKWLKNLRQYRGMYDPEVAKGLSADRSKAYPRITRVKCISVVSRVMNLMFPGNERNWTLKASPNAEMSPDDVMEAMRRMQEEAQKAGSDLPPFDERLLQSAVQALAEERAEGLKLLIDDQLQELGGDQTSDYVRLNKQIVDSGTKFGVGYLRGPSAREVKRTRWVLSGGKPVPQEETQYKPHFDFSTVWDTYIDMSATRPETGDGYFVRLVMSRSQLRKLSEREDFSTDAIDEVIKEHPKGNYKPKGFETELRSMGLKEAEDSTYSAANRYEVLIWNGPVRGSMLHAAGGELADDKLKDDVQAEVWMVGNTTIKAELNAWSQLGVEMRQLHAFVFDEDDTAPIGNGLPDVMRDSQMSVSAATRMLLDNASVTCGPNLEVNVDALMPETDMSAITSYKIWQRDGTTDPSVPAVRNITIDNHMGELTKIIEVFMAFADQETFVGPATGGDMERGFSEPMRTAAGASMLRGDAALPFKDIVRNFDAFTQSVIQSIVLFNRRLNPDLVPSGDFNVIARGATSLIAKEIRGMQVDQLAQTLTPEERIHVDERMFVEARFKTRDLDSMLVPAHVAEARIAARSKKQTEMEEQQAEMMRAEIRETMSAAFKNITQGQKNANAAEVNTVKAALDILMKGGEDDRRRQESEQAGQGQPPQNAAKSGGVGRA